MEIRQAILKAAEFVEQNPDRFSFFATISPYDAASYGCYVGWIAWFAGEESGQQCGAREFDAPLCRRLLGIPFWEFSDRIGRIQLVDLRASIASQETAGKALRLYADKYHPATSDTKSERHTTPQVTTTPKAFDFEALAARLAREPRAEEIAHAL